MIRAATTMFTYTLPWKTDSDEKLPLRSNPALLKADIEWKSPIPNALAKLFVIL